MSWLAGGPGLGTMRKCHGTSNQRLVGRTSFAGWDYCQHGCSLWSYTARVSGLSQSFPEGLARDMIADVSASYMLAAAMFVVTVALGPLALSLGCWLGPRLRPHDKSKKVSTARASRKRVCSVA
jgi:hypothetical protein